MTASSRIILGPFDSVLSSLERESVDVVYADPPFGLGGKRKDPRDDSVSYDDVDLEALLIMLRTLAVEARRILKTSGSLFLHLDDHAVFDAKVRILDGIFGRENFVGSIIWNYDWGARQRGQFAKKHDTILHYAVSRPAMLFDVERVDRVPYKAPGLQMYRSKRLGRDDGAERIARGKPVTDVFSDINVVGTNSRERSLYSYPTMKPAKLIRRLLAPTTTEGGLVIDPFCGSGPTVEAATSLGCSFVVGDVEPRAVELARSRFERISGENIEVESC